MKAWIELLRDLCFLKRAPQDLPYSPIQLATLCVVLGALTILAALRLQGIPDPLPQTAFWIGMMLVLPAIALQVAGLSPRFVQAASALIGIKVVFKLLEVPVLLLAGDLAQAYTQPTTRTMLAALVAMPLLVWELAVRGHILRHALDVPMRVGVVTGIVFYVVELMAVAMVFGQPVPGKP